MEQNEWLIVVGVRNFANDSPERNAVMKRDDGTMQNQRDLCCLVYNITVCDEKCLVLAELYAIPTWTTSKKVATQRQVSMFRRYRNNGTSIRKLSTTLFNKVILIKFYEGD